MLNDKNWAIIVAAGSSIRFGSDKLFFKIKNPYVNKVFPLLYYSLNSFSNCKQIKGIILVTSKKNLRNCKKLVLKYNFNKVKKIVLGGEERQDSVYQGLLGVPKDCNIVCIHDGARPLISKKLLKICIGSAEKFKNCIPVIPVNDTLKEIKENLVINTLNKSKYFLTQTPQCFRFNYFINLFLRAMKERKYFTDEASLLEYYKKKVFVVKGEHENIKVTDKEDVRIIKAYLS